MLNDQQQPPVIFLMGPTASGKTQLAIDLVQQLQGQIISVDSAMIYRGMDIGTAKPEADELALAPHKLIDICDPSEAYSAAQFRHDALKYIEDCYKIGKWPTFEQELLSNPKTFDKKFSTTPKSAWTAFF